MTAKKVIRALNVDDSKMMRAMVRKALDRPGFELTQGDDGLEGLELLKNFDGKPDIILTDINMPNLDGYGFITEIRKLKDYKTIPIICLTTEVGDDKKKRARECGATGWMKKPFDAEELIKVIRRVTR